MAAAGIHHAVKNKLNVQIMQVEFKNAGLQTDFKDMKPKNDNEPM